MFFTLKIMNLKCILTKKIIYMWWKARVHNIHYITPRWVKRYFGCVHINSNYPYQLVNVFLEYSILNQKHLLKKIYDLERCIILLCKDMTIQIYLPKNRSSYIALRTLVTCLVFVYVVAPLYLVCILANWVQKMKTLI